MKTQVLVTRISQPLSLKPNLFRNMARIQWCGNILDSSKTTSDVICKVCFALIGAPQIFTSTSNVTTKCNMMRPYKARGPKDISISLFSPYSAQYVKLLFLVTYLNGQLNVNSIKGKQLKGPMA